MSSLESDFSAWVSMQTAAAGPTIPAQLPDDAEEMLRGIGEVDLMDEFLKDSGKDYLPKDVQSSFVHGMNVMVTAGKELVSVLASQTRSREFFLRVRGRRRRRIVLRAGWAALVRSGSLWLRGLWWLLRFKQVPGFCMRVGVRVYLDGCKKTIDFSPIS